MRLKYKILLLAMVPLLMSLTLIAVALQAQQHSLAERRGYFFLYDLDGVNLMHPRQPELVGRNLIEMRDAGGEPTSACCSSAPAPVAASWPTTGASRRPSWRRPSWVM